MSKAFHLFSILFSIAVFSSCATIVSKSSYPVSFGSSPAGTTVTVTNREHVEVFKGKTPCAVKLKAGSRFFSKEQYTLKFSRPGYEDKVVPINFKINGWYFGNVLIGGVIGMLIVDPATGAMWKIEQDNFYEKFDESDRKAAVTQPALNIVSVNNIADSLKSRMVKLN
jgi:hypothetical protein